MKQEKTRPGGLGPYRAKRSADRTPEPFGGEPRPSAGTGGLFVVQKHGARRLHYDFRLEMGGALHSWAVPKGPSFDPAEKRLAVEVEDHPLEYADFEGVIPEGNYGAGPVIVWDRGRWVPVEDPAAGLRKGKLLFDLYGFKLRGRWTLVRTKGSGREWLLIKKPDEASRGGEARPESVLSGLTLEELRDGARPAEEVRRELERLGAPRRKVPASSAGLMLAESRDEPFSAAGWLFEVKIDGFRLLVERRDGDARLLYRRGHDATSTFPDVAAAVGALPFGDALFDGEVTVLDDRGHPSFQGLQKRVPLTRPRDVERAAVEHPATVYLFDLLAFEGFDCRPLPLATRKRLLARLVPRVGPLRLTESFEREGERLYDEILRLGLEGVMAKKADSPYRAGRSAAWLKIRVEQTGDFAVVGFTEPKGTRAGLGALHLGVFERRGGEKTLVYAGRVGSGFTSKGLEDLRRRLDGARRARPAFIGSPPTGRSHVWVEPELVVEVRYHERTEEGLLRQPVFLRLREDKAVEDCERAAAPGVLESPPETVPPPPAVERRISFTNLDKVFWPDEGYTKGDLIEFYRGVAPWMLPYLRDRPIVLTRYPDGIGGKSFFQKDAPGFVPGWIRTERMWSEHAEREIDYFIADDVESLVYLANLGTIPIHAWSSRRASLARPDWCILDLDPKGAPFSHVVRVARAIRALGRTIGLETFPKTSGATGLHVLIPLAGRCTYDESRTLGELLARVIVAELPEIATITRAVRARRGKVYVDYLQNGHGKTIVAPFSVRPLPGAPVSTPLRWSEVNDRLDPSRFTVRTVPTRMRRARRDPMRAVLGTKNDLTGALERLAEHLDSG